MKLKENDTIMSSEVFIFESGEPVKKDILEGKIIKWNI